MLSIRNIHSAGIESGSISLSLRTYAPVTWMLDVGLPFVVKALDLPGGRVELEESIDNTAFDNDV